MKVNLEDKLLEQEWKIVTDKTFRVDKVYKTEETTIQPWEEIRIRFSGGQVDKNIQDFEIKASKNNKYILLLTPCKNYPEINEAAFTVVTGNNGLFKINGDENPKYKDISSIEILENKVK